MRTGNISGAVDAIDQSVTLKLNVRHDNTSHFLLVGRYSRGLRDLDFVSIFERTCTKSLAESLI